MSDDKRDGPLVLDDFHFAALKAETDGMAKNVEELAKLGCMFVVPGDLFKNMVDFIDRLLTDGGADLAGRTWLLNMRALLLQHSKPVRAKARDTRIVVPH